MKIIMLQTGLVCALPGGIASAQDVEEDTLTQLLRRLTESERGSKSFEETLAQRQSGRRFSGARLRLPRVVEGLAACLYGRSGNTNQHGIEAGRLMLTTNPVSSSRSRQHKALIPSTF